MMEEPVEDGLVAAEGVNSHVGTPDGKHVIMLSACLLSCGFCDCCWLVQPSITNVANAVRVII